MTFIDSEDAKRIEASRKKRVMALSILQKAKNSGIPLQYQRINKEKFTALLDDKYHVGTVPDIASLVYDDKEKLMKIPCILIDGGDSRARKAAGCAILFRMIFYQNEGVFQDCKTLIRIFNMYDKDTETPRSPLMEHLKRCRAIFVSEFKRDNFIHKLQASEYIDEILSSRSDAQRSTIVSFSQSIVEQDKMVDNMCGQELAIMSGVERLDPNPSDTYLRIRVKS